MRTDLDERRQSTPGPGLFKRRHLRPALAMLSLLLLAEGVAAFLLRTPEPASAPSEASVAAAVPSTSTGRGNQHSRGGILPEALETRSIEVGQGDTLMALLVTAGAAPEEASEAVQALEAIYDPRSLKVGQQITVTFASPGTLAPAGDPERADTETRRLVDVTVSADVDRKVLASRMLSPDDKFSGQEQRQELTPGLSRFAGAIDDSLFEAAGRAGLPAPVTAEVIRLFSYDVDFQRDIHPGDTFEVKVERLFDGDGRAAKDGAITFASLTLSGVTRQLWRFQPSTGEADYFDATGNSVRKALLRTPIDGARITSGFGMRQHPILGYSKMHKGLDFGAATGTPIMAAGDGTVAFAGDKGAYGRYVQLRHPNGYATAYAHMSRIAVKRGQTVRQGQVIGYVGSTGRSTGPHLHYEVLARDRQLNPAGLKLPAGRKLAGAELVAFQKARTAIDAAPTREPLVTAAHAAQP
jgi:murein DD-endopeptidase MepM/ murein hydrolase activator NlpD